jgi:phage shock protein PspC (stress-responsive transcriptional regulator)
MTFKWIRAKDGVLFGVCKGIARALDLPVGLVRLIWILCVLIGGVGLGAYLLLAISLPHEDKVYESLQPRILGVCALLAKRSDLEVGMVRFLALCLLFASLGLTSVIYLISYFVLDDQESVASRSNPSRPPSTT